MVKKSKLKCPKCKIQNDQGAEECCNCQSTVIKTGMLKKKDLKKMKEI